ncbi:copper chaperone PCu(A)C [Ferrimonas senticii]|uniref:copper chaperone PCu(A)C n=1 Tax=Ferrimonas senticii TaxID=394566 RepID=UPI00040A6308|nr:copper chaperone PCu(A)C [Ferrimonas senticii]
MRIKRLFEFAAITLMVSASVQAAQVQISDAMARAMPPSVPNTAGYAKLTADTDDRLLAAQCDGVERTEIHTILMEDGLMKMRPVAAVELPQGREVLLEQGGYHLMMMGLNRAAKVGGSYDCQLTFAKAPPQLVRFVVRAIQQPQAETHQHHHH